MEQVIFFILKGTGHRFPAIFFDECFEICRAVTSQDVYGVEGPEIGRLIRKERERRLSQRLPNYQEARYEREA